MEQQHPWCGSWGIYKHFHTQIEGSTVRFIPSFVFGAPQLVIDWLYGVADGVPVAGMFTETISKDRVVVQCFMNLVIISVLFLLWVHNKHPS